MKQRGITVAGSMLVDYVKLVDVYPKKGMLCNVGNISRSVGGCVPNTLCDLAALDSQLPLKCLGVVAEDENGRFLKAELEKRNIDIEDVVTVSEESTAFTDVMTVESTGERTFFYASGSNKIFEEIHIPLDKLYEGIFHIGYALMLNKLEDKDEEYGIRLARLLDKIQQLGIATSMDAVSEESGRFEEVILPTLKYLNYLIVNEIEMERISNVKISLENGSVDEEAMRNACEKTLGYGVREWVVVHAPGGAWAMNAKREFYACPSLKLPENYIKGSVGAGDAFCAGMLLCLYKGTEMSEALKIANASAASNLSATDSVSGMQSLEEVKKLYAKYAVK